MAESAEINFNPDDSAPASRGIFKAVITKAEPVFKEQETKTRDDGSTYDMKATHVLEVEYTTSQYDKAQPEWYPFANAEHKPIKMDGSKWMNFLGALKDSNALKEITTKGTTDDERMKSFADQLLGMEFDIEDVTDYPLGVKYSTFITLKKEGKPLPSGRQGRTINSLLLPIKYYGKKDIPKAASRESVSESID